MTMAKASLFVDMANRLFDGADRSDGFDTNLWARVEESGLALLLVPEDQGGAGEAFSDAGAVMLCAGARAVSIPLIETMVANRIMALAGEQIQPGPKALVTWPDIDTDGPLACVWGAEASVVVVLERGDEARLVTLTGADVRCGETVAGEPLAWLSHETLRGGRKVSLRHGDDVRNLAVALAMQSAALAGAMQTICEMSIDYANTRVQFGRAISRFQAVQRMATTLAIEAAATRSAAEAAIAGLTGRRSLWSAAVAKARASEAAGVVAENAHQLHGAIGYTREFGLHRLSRRLWSWRERFGSDAYWYSHIGSASLKCGSGQLWPSIVQGMDL